MSCRVCVGEREAGLGCVGELREWQSFFLIGCGMPFQLLCNNRRCPWHSRPGQGVRRATPATAKPSSVEEDSNGVLREHGSAQIIEAGGEQGTYRGKTQRSDPGKAGSTTGKSGCGASDRISWRNIDPLKGITLQAWRTADPGKQGHS